MELEPFLTRNTGERFYLIDGIYRNTMNLATVEKKIPRWLPHEHPTVWHPGLGQELRIVGLQETAGVYQYQCVVVNSSDTNQRIFSEGQLQSLDEAERPPSEGEKLPVNRSPWTPIKDTMTRFLASYPVAEEKLRKELDAMIKSANRGLAKQVYEERQSERGFFLGESDFTERMRVRYPSFPWSDLAPIFDYSAPIK